MIEVETNPDSCTIAVSHPGQRATITVSRSEAIRIMELVGYHYGLGQNPEEAKEDPLDEALEEHKGNIERQKDGFFWRLFHGK